MSELEMDAQIKKVKSFGFNVIYISVDDLFDYKKINCALFAGVNSQYVLKQHAELDLKTENVENILSYTNLHMNKFSLAGICGLSMDVKLTKKISLFVEPHFKINFFIIKPVFYFDWQICKLHYFFVRVIHSKLRKHSRN